MYISLHNHTAIGSNTRGFLDSINTVEKMVAYAKELNHTGLCITDHDSLTAHIDLLHHIKSLREKDPEKWKDFKPICGNEIYASPIEAAEVSGTGCNSKDIGHICNVSKGHYSTRGFHWIYVDDYNKLSQDEKDKLLWHVNNSHKIIICVET